MNQVVKKIAKYLITAGGVFWATSCQFFNGSVQEFEGEPLARVYNSYLYQSDLEDILPSDLSETDSIAFVQNFINVWAKDQLMIYKAEYNLTEKKKNFEKQIEEYRNDLLKFAYLQEYVQQNLDTVVSDTAILRNYENGSNNFLLKENIVMVSYIVVNKEAPDLKKAIRWFDSSKEKDQESLHDFALKYAYQYSLEDSSWVSFDVVKKIVPLVYESESNFVETTKSFQDEDESNVYMLKIWDYKLKGDKAPLPYAKGIINNILLNKRKLELLGSLEEKLLEDALSKKEFEVY